MFTELLPNLYFVSGEGHAQFPFSNGLMLETGLRVLVDTGFGPSRIDVIKAAGKVDVIVNTHFHIDHAYGNQFFPEAQIWAHVFDAPALRSPEQFRAYTGYSGICEFPDFAGGPPAQVVDRELGDGDVLDFGSLVLQVIHTPGHTPGHIALFEAKSRILFAGDIDLSPFGPWYGNERSDLQEFRRSIKRLIALNPKVIVTGHSGIISDNIQERLKNYLDKFDLRDELILQHLCTAKTLADLVEMKIIYPRFPEPQRVYRFFEETMLKKHLQSLLSQGKVFVKQNQRYKAYA